MSEKWSEVYPRPQLKRDEWMSLDGKWSLGIKKEGEPGIPPMAVGINVPFCPESSLSGVSRHIEADEVMYYGRSFTVPEDWEGRRVLLHFGAVDQTAKVYIDGNHAGDHEGGYLPFSMDITDMLKNEDLHSIIVEVRDSLDRKYPWGRQKTKSGGKWYTAVSGIWQSVWLEPVPEEHITSLRIDTGDDWAEITASGINGGILEVEGEKIEMDPVSGGVFVRIRFDEPRLWSPEDPHLYEFEIVSGEDRVKSYLALRTLTIEEKDGYPRLCLNGKPYYFDGVLDRGYWHDGIYTPSSPECYAVDIRAMKSLGYNTLRKHIKIEPELFYYECDRLGMVVFQDMVNNSDYSFLHDTALPGIGFKKLEDKNAHNDPESRKIFRESMEETVKHLYNHPSVCYWTIFNEGWGQFDADAAYDRLKSLDGSRFIDSTSGWFRQSKSDVDSHHVYSGMKAPEAGARPMVLSEFGGYACKVPGHYFGRSRGYGFRKCPDTASLARDIEALYRDGIEPLKEKGLSAAIYTQLSDVEDDTSGLLTYDRRVMKVDPEKFRKG